MVEENESKKIFWENLGPTIALLVTIFLFFVVQNILKNVNEYNDTTILYTIIFFAPFFLIFFGKLANQIIHIFSSGANIPLITYKYIIGENRYTPLSKTEKKYRRKEISKTILKLYFYYLTLSLLVLFFIKNSLIKTQSDIYLNNIQIVILACLIAFIPRVLQLTNPILSRKILMSIFTPLAVISAPTIILHPQEIQLFGLSDFLTCIILSGFLVIVGDFAADFARKIQIIKLELNVNTVANFPLWETIKVKQEQFEFDRLAEIFVEAENSKRNHEITIIENNLYNSYNFGNEIRNPELRRSVINSVYLICEKGTKKPPLNILNSALKDDYVYIRHKTVKVLSWIDSEETIDSLAQVLLNDTNGAIRGRAAFALGKINSKRVIGPLTKALLNDKDSFVRSIAAMSLSPFDANSVIKPLIQALQKDEDLYVRRNIIKTLTYITSEYVHSDEVLETLEKIHKGEENEKIREDIKDAIKTITS